MAHHVKIVGMNGDDLLCYIDITRIPNFGESLFIKGQDRKVFEVFSEKKLSKSDPDYTIIVMSPGFESLKI